MTKNATVSATVESMVLNRMALRMERFVFLELAALHQRRVQIQIVRHHRRADDADGDVDHAAWRKRGVTSARPISEKAGPGLRQYENFDEVADGDGRDQHQHDRFDGAHAEALQASSSSTSRPVMITAQSSGMWNSRLSATALPSTSARSQAPIANLAEQPVRPARPARDTSRGSTGPDPCRSPRRGAPR